MNSKEKLKALIPQDPPRPKIKFKTWAERYADYDKIQVRKKKSFKAAKPLNNTK